MLRLPVSIGLLFTALTTLAQFDNDILMSQRFVTRYDTLFINMVLTDNQKVEASIVSNDSLIMTRVDHLMAGYTRWTYPLDGLNPGNYILLMQQEGLHRQWPFTVLPDAQ
ncbi:MAG: hypothetical protein JNM00_00905 [Flavobacteriales bacterium]|nr:hypothetical protein [Flavobacteriales bacterium]